MAQLKQYYQEKIVPQLSRELGFGNTMRVPKITKVVLNIGNREAIADKKILETATNDVDFIMGHKVVVT